ncbi:MAG: YlxR family protein [Aggregatilineales bacterium]
MAKHVPMRTCIICRQKASKRMLTRVVHTEQGLQIDPTGKMNGRGAYLCDSVACWERAVVSDALSRALKVVLTDDDRVRLRQAGPQP